MPKPTPRRRTAAAAAASKARRSREAPRHRKVPPSREAPRRRTEAVARAPPPKPRAPEGRRPEAYRRRPEEAPRAEAVVDGSPHVNPEGEFLWESSPSRYIARMSSVTGREVLRPIDPDELLIQAHRDKNPLEVTAQFLASRLIQVTGNEESVRDAMKKINELGTRMAGRLGQMTGSKAIERGARQVIGVVDREFFFQFREATRLSEREVKARIARLQEDARAALAARGRNPRLRVLLTGATGFLGQEILAQAASDRRIAEVVSVIRPQTVRDPKTKEVVRVLSPTERGRLLLSRIGIGGRAARKFRFVDGDIEKPFLGIGEKDLADAREDGHARHPLRGLRLLRRHLRELLPGERRRLPRTPSPSRFASSGRRGRGSSSTSPSRPPTSTAARSGRWRRRTRSSSPRTSTTTSTS